MNILNLIEYRINRMKVIVIVNKKTYFVNIPKEASNLSLTWKCVYEESKTLKITQIK